jgi:hypothetical protein
VHGSVTEQEVWRIRTNEEFRKLYETPDLVANIEIRFLIGACNYNVSKTEAKKMYERKPESRRKEGRWMQEENNTREWHLS